MLIKLNRPDIIENIKSRFDAQETGPRPSMQLEDTTRLILDIDKLTADYRLQSAVVAVTGVANYIGLTVPDGEIWLPSYVVMGISTGNYTFDWLVVSDGTTQASLAYQSAATYYSSGALGTARVMLAAGWGIGFHIAAVTTPGDAYIRAFTQVVEGY